jgi:hypothetical protein
MLQQARDQGVRLGRIQWVDSVHTQAAVNAEKDRKRQEQGQASRDPDARVVYKGKRDVVEPDGRKSKQEVCYRGYKTHIAMDAKTRLVTSVLPSWGDSADNKAFPDLLAHDLALGLPTHTYGGDKAYDDTDLVERLEQRGLHAGLKLCPRVEEPFGQAKDKHAFERCRYLGRMNYGIQAFLTFMGVDAKRIVKLLTGITLREQAKGCRKEVFKPVYTSLPWASCVDQARGCVKRGPLAH